MLWTFFSKCTVISSLSYFYWFSFLLILNDITKFLISKIWSSLIILEMYKFNGNVRCKSISISHANDTFHIKFCPFFSNTCNSIINLKLTICKHFSVYVKFQVSQTLSLKINVQILLLVYFSFILSFKFRNSL